MNRINEMGIGGAWRRHGAIKLVCLAALAALLGGCYSPAANRDFDRDGIAPWWCKGSPDLLKPECVNLSVSFDIAVDSAKNFVNLAAFTTAGATEVANRPANIGVAFTKVATPTTFNAYTPNVLLYDSNTPTARLVGVAWEINAGVVAPDGFPGDRDVWSQNGTTNNWWLTTWIVRGYENHPNVFAASHPCLTSSGTILTATTNACFLASHTQPFKIVVTNDDGYSAPGIGSLVEGLIALPNVQVDVVAPFANQSGSSDQVTLPPYTVSASSVATPLPGGGTYLGTAISSTDPNPPRSGSGSPADSVRYAINIMKLSPDVVVSGMNLGQNIGGLANLSGTVGAARTARRTGIAAIATSQGGFAPPNDFPTGRVATLALLEQWRLGRTVNTTSSVLNINTPTCAVGVPRGTLLTAWTTVLGAGQSYTTQNCQSIVTTINDDVDAFNHGYIGIANVGI